MFRQVDNYISFEGRFEEVVLRGFISLGGQASVCTLGHWVEMIRRLAILFFLLSFVCMCI